MAANAGETKVKLWEGICYPENMLDDWQEEIDDILQVPFAYAIHDIDHDQKSKQRKTHVHIIVVWGGNTTRKAIINVLNRLSADGKVYVDGRRLDESYAIGESKPLDAHLSLAPDSYPYTIPDGCIWVMGDNRENSADSRYFGPVEEDSVIGIVFARYFPFDRIGSVS